MTKYFLLIPICHSWFQKLPKEILSNNFWEEHLVGQDRYKNGTRSPSCVTPQQVSVCCCTSKCKKENTEAKHTQLEIKRLKRRRKRTIGDY